MTFRSVSNSRSPKKEQQSIEAAQHLEAFFAAGGKIQQIPVGTTASEFVSYKEQGKKGKAAARNQLVLGRKARPVMEEL